MAERGEKFTSTAGDTLWTIVAGRHHMAEGTLFRSGKRGPLPEGDRKALRRTRLPLPS